MIRQPICVFLGHVDHGKTTIQDFIKKTAIAKSEAGGITQAISSSTIKIDLLKKLCGDRLSKNLNITLPGILFIDTPGHAAFSNLRKRGGNLADIAILVIDANEGIMPQTAECIEILKTYKTPFIIALNKVDLIYGWKKHKENLLENLSLQNKDTAQVIETSLYNIVGKLFESGIESDRFDRVSDFTKQVAIVPCSGKTGDGIPELLMVLIGLAQKFLEKSLEIDENSAGKGTILEIRDEKGLGTALDAILYDGVIKQNDTIVIGNPGAAIVTKIRGIFSDSKKPMDKVQAAAGVRILANEVKNVISGVPFIVANNNLENAKNEVQSEVNEVFLETDGNGIVIKADSLGSLEALQILLHEKGIKIKNASVGKITKKDIADAKADSNEINRVILGFNVDKGEALEGVHVIVNNVIYKIIEDYEAWVELQKKKKEEKNLELLSRPAKIQIIRGCIFRQSNPCVVGVKVLAGKLKNDVDLIKKDGSKAGHLKSMQKKRENVEEALKNEEVAISIPGVTGGRQILEEDILFVDITENEFKELKKFKKLISQDEIEALKELAEIKRKENAVWGI